MANKDFLVRFKADTKNYDANIAKAKRSLDAFAKDNLSAGGIMKQLSGSLISTAARFASVTAAVGALGAALRSNIQTAKEFEKSMSQLSSLTGMVGNDLDTLKGYAIELGSSTTLTASQVADAFKMIGSQQPQLLQSAEALKEVTKNAITLSEAAGIDLATASQTLSTSINQMGGDSNNAARFINVLAAASQKGAGNIQWLGEAITKSGTTAKMVGTSYEELVANLEMLAKAGFDASTAGTALRSIIINLEKQADDNLKPSVVGLTTAMENLGKKNLSVGELAGVVGKMFSGQAQTLAENADEARELQKAITDTNTAEEQAKTNTDNLDGALKSLASAWEGLNLHINDSNGFLRDCVDWLKDVVKWADAAFTSAGRASKALADAQESPIEGKTQIDLKIDALKILPKERQSAQQSVDIYNLQKQIEKKRQEYAEWSPLIPWETPNNAKKREEFENEIKALETMLSEYRRRSNEILNPTTAVTNAPENKVNLEFEVNTENATKSIKELQNQLKELKQLRDDAAESGDFAARDDYNEEIKSVQSQIKALRGNSAITKQTKPIEGFNVKDIQELSVGTTQSMNELRSKLQEYQKMLANATDQFVASAAQEGIKETQRLIDAQPLALKLGISADAAADLQDKVKSLKDIVQEGLESDPVVIKAKLEAENNSNNKNGDGTNGSSKETGTKYLSQLSGSVSSMVGSLEQLGVKLPDGFKDVVNGLNAITSILTTISTIMSAIEAFSAAGSIPFFAHGGIVPHAAMGYTVPGTHYSGDVTPILANAGEVVLNRAQVGVLASELSSSGEKQNGGQTYVSGEQIFLAVNNYLRRSGYGEIVTSRR